MGICFRFCSKSGEFRFYTRQSRVPISDKNRFTATPLGLQSFELTETGGR